jgi:hypothetical protein
MTNAVNNIHQAVRATNEVRSRLTHALEVLTASTYINGFACHSRWSASGGIGRDPMKRTVPGNCSIEISRSGAPAFLQTGRDSASRPIDRDCHD